MPEPTQPKAEQAAASGDVNAAQQLLNDKMAASGIDPDTLQLLMQMTAVMAKTMAVELRKPTEEEQKKLDAEMQRIKNQRIQAAAQGKAIADQIRAEQSACGHVKPNGEHTFRGQVHSNGWAEIRCQRCQKAYRVRPTTEMMASGLNLSDIKGLTEAHLLSWSQNSPKIDEAQRQMQQQQQTTNPFAAPGGAVGAF
jgi:hypothetical protein